MSKDTSDFQSIYEQMVYHTTCVNKGNDHAFVIADMPFMSYSSPEYTPQKYFPFLIQPDSHMVKIAGDLWLSEIMKQFIQNVEIYNRHYIDDLLIR